tara:strand:+ start:378 stop:1628 length:1251 start_codon:yes stop_codon:yes gene_type:complete
MTYSFYHRLIAFIILIIPTIINAQVHVPDSSFRAYLNSEFDIKFDKTNHITDINKVKSVKRIDIYNVIGITDLTGIEAFSNLEDLYILNQQIKKLNLSKNKNLKRFKCGRSGLEEIDLSNNPLLLEIDLSSNQLQNLDISQNSLLTSVDVRENQITSLVLSNNLFLKELNCSNNQLSDINLSKNIELEIASLSSNKLTAIDVSQNTLLGSLNIYDNQLKSLDVSQNTLLSSLMVQGNQLTNIDVSQNTLLSSLSIYDNQLTSLDLSKTKMNDGSTINLYTDNYVEIIYSSEAVAKRLQKEEEYIQERKNSNKRELIKYSILGLIYAIGLIFLIVKRDVKQRRNNIFNGLIIVSTLILIISFSTGMTNAKDLGDFLIFAIVFLVGLPIHIIGVLGKIIIILNQRRIISKKKDIKTLK